MYILFKTLKRGTKPSSCAISLMGRFMGEGADPLQHSALQEESPPEIHIPSRCDDSLGSVNVSIGNSEVSLVSLGRTDVGAEVEVCYFLLSLRPTNS